MIGAKSTENGPRFVLNHLMTSQVYLVTFWRGLTSRFGTNGLNHLPVYKVVKISSNSKMLLRHWCMFVCVDTHKHSSWLKHQRETNVGKRLIL